MAGARPGPRVVVWGLLWLLAAAALANTAWQLFGHIPDRIDIDVYQMGGQTWLGRCMCRTAVT